MYNTLNEYKKYKDYESMIFGEIDYNKLSKLCNESDAIFFRKVIIHMLMLHYISKSELKNIYLILECFKNNNISLSVINSISKLLDRDFLEDLYFYRKEMFIRTKKFKYLNKISDKEIISMKGEINEYILNDILLFKYLDNTNDIKIDYQKLIYSIRTYLHEYPEMFVDESIYNTAINLLNDEENNKDTTKIQKKINRKVKRLNRRK